MSQPMPLPAPEPPAHPRGRKLPRKYAQVVFLFVMTLCMCLTQSLVTTYRLQGPGIVNGNGFLFRWANTFIHAYVVLIPMVVVVVPIARRITRRVVEE